MDSIIAVFDNIYWLKLIDALYYVKYVALMYVSICHQNKLCKQNKLWKQNKLCKQIGRTVSLFLSQFAYNIFFSLWVKHC